MVIHTGFGVQESRAVVGGWGRLLWNVLSAGKVWALGACRGESAVPSRDLDAGVSLGLRLHPPLSLACFFPWGSLTSGPSPEP